MDFGEPDEMDVSDVLRDRMQPPEGLRRMVAVSFLAHAALAAGIVLAPEQWLSSTDQAPRTVMTISFSSGAPGPNTGGMNQIGGQMIQSAAEALKREPPSPPAAAKTPEMTVPVDTKAPVKPVQKPPVKQAPADARGRALSRGAAEALGSTPVETGVRGQGFGLSSSGGTGSGVRLDITGDFCCPAYLEAMKQQIERNWDRRAESPAMTVMKFTILRDGTVKDVELEKRSGVAALDLRAQRAMALTPKLPPLPDLFTNPTLTVHLTFEYTR
jgi:TonB family protein